MNITEVRIKLMESSEDRLRAFCSITIDDCFVVRDLKIIDGSSGPFVAMPSRKLAGHCPKCRYKNHLRANYCNQCGAKINLDADFTDSPQKLYADVAHPINSECRELIQEAVIEEFDAELSRSHQPGYRSRYDDDFGYDAGPDTDMASSDAIIDPPNRSGPNRPKYADRKPNEQPTRSASTTRSASPTQESSEPAGSDDSESGDFGAGVFD